MDADEISFSPDSVRKKQKLRTILTTIGESLQTVFKNHIYESIGERPSLISIDDVNSIEKGTSKSKVHFVTYYLNTDIGKQSVNLVVKFSADEVRYDKEIKNYSLISSVPSRFPGIYIPKIIYKSAQNRCIIYEGVTGTSFRETQLDKNFKHQLAGQTLSAIQICPKDKTGLVKSHRVSYSKIQAPFGAASMRLRLRKEDGSITTKHPSIISADKSIDEIKYEIGGIEMAEGDIIFWECIAVAANDTPIEARFNVEFKDVA